MARRVAWRRGGECSARGN